MLIKVQPNRLKLTDPTNPFLVRELASSNEEVKQPQRERVVEFFARHQFRKPAKCFCLPGARWAFERELDRTIKGPVEFVGCERDRAILHASLDWMPGFGRVYEEIETKTDRFCGYRTDKASVLWCEMSRFLDHGSRCFKNKAQHKQFNRQYKGWTCVWLDFCGKVGPDMTVCMKRIENYVDFDTPSVPLAVTFTVGREAPETSHWFDVFCPNGDALEKRVRYLQAISHGNRCRDLEIQDSWTYRSTGGSTMGMLMGFLKLRKGSRNGSR